MEKSWDVDVSERKLLSLQIERQPMDVSWKPIETFGSLNISTSIYNYLFIKKYILLQIFSILLILSRSFIGSERKRKVKKSLLHWLGFNFFSL